MRTAIYFTPAPDHPLTLAAARWLGRNVYGDEAVGEPDHEGISPQDWRELTAAPRRYGFHATLKAPFSLDATRSVAGLDTAIQAWATETAPFELPALALRRIGSFFALVPGEPSETLQGFAGDVVKAFELFRAPLDEVEFARRTKADLTQRQVESVRKWGYPYVFDDFRFHMTLTGPVPQEKQALLQEVLGRQFAEFIGKPLTIDALALCVEPAAGADFTVFSRHALREP
ncbi:DUF1045 domain-containing protein [Breoghania sp.]|uniref:DUF1045 domain-containing protein n=1 Tax=Breoghania sp. TaxID=2065378 RepID=UPI002AA7C69D|nr:DUF1045 domain-containing protein [Breoghania sp.]